MSENSERRKRLLEGLQKLGFEISFVGEKPSPLVLRVIKAVSDLIKKSQKAHERAEDSKTHFRLCVQEPNL